MSSLPPNITALVDRRLMWRYIFAGLCASLESIGLARFAFTPLIPELIRAQWFSASAVVYLSAANLAGYVLGALIGRPLTAWLASERILRIMMVLIAATFLACAVPLSVSWYFSWRFLSGVAGGVVMVLVAGTILPHVPASKKGTAGGAIFLGLGLGIAGSGTLIPLLLQFGLAQTWVGLGALSLILTAASWFAWPSSTRSTAMHEQQKTMAPAVTVGPKVKILYVQYALMASAVVPTMLFLVDYISRGLDQGTHTGSVFWAIYGLGAIAGPPLYGYFADRWSARSAIIVISSIMTLVLLGYWVSSNLLALGILTLIFGTFAPGMVPLVLARVHELIPQNHTQQNASWTRASVIAAAGLALSAYAFSALFNATGGDYRVLFLTAAVLLIIVIVGELATPRRYRMTALIPADEDTAA